MSTWRWTPTAAGARGPLMRDRLKTFAVSKALDRLRRTKVGEMRVGDTSTLLAMAAMAEQSGAAKSYIGIAVSV